MSLDIRPLCPELQEKARKELNEVPERIAEDLAKVREWLAKQPHLHARSDDQFLVNFLRGSKYSLERTKEKLDLTYTVRTAMPEMFKNRDPTLPTNAELIKLGVLVPLPNTITPDGPRIMLIRPGRYDPQKYSIEDVFRVNSHFMDILLQEDDNMVVAGQMGIIDLSNCTMAHFLQMSPSTVKRITVLSQDASPLRLKGFHYVHTPSGFEMVFNLFKKFLNEKNRNRLYVHGDNMESLYEHVPKKLLPAEYGGEAGPIQDVIDQWEKKILSYRKFFEEDEQYRTEESKRPGRPKNSESIFGIEGSFRKLNVD